MSEKSELTVIENALDTVANPEIPLKDRAAVYAVLRTIRLRIDRVIKPITQEIAEAMVREDARRWGPLRLSMRAKDPIYVVNHPGNHDDAAVQDLLEQWENYTNFRPFIKRIIAHREIDTGKLAVALQKGDPGAQGLFDLLNENKLRIVPRKDATLIVDEVK